MIISSGASDAVVGCLPSETLDGKSSDFPPSIQSESLPSRAISTSNFDAFASSSAVTNSSGKTMDGDGLSAHTQVRGDRCSDSELSNSSGVSSSAKAISTVSDGNRYDPMANTEDQLKEKVLPSHDQSFDNSPIHTGDSKSLQDEPSDFPFLDPTEIQTDSEDDEDKNKSAMEGEPEENLSRLPISSLYPRSFYSRCICNRYGSLDRSASLWNSPCGPGCEFRPRFSDSWNSSRWKYRRQDRPPSFSVVEETGVGAGLYNLGNTCFLNAILQCFTHTVPVIKALRSSNHLMPCQRGIEGFCVACVLRNHMEHSISSSGKTISPSQLVDNLDKISSDFHRYQQEDAHEFLQCLLDKLERCCLDSTQKETLSSQDDNIVQRVFGGRLVSKLRCCKCGHCSEKYESLIDLSLEIEDAETLQNALESFTKVEKIEDSEARLKCDNCKEEVSMEKQLMLDRAPSVAALHLKRFKSDGSSIEKIGKPVDFPLELDLEPYSNGYKDSYDPQEHLKYQLYGVVVHNGDSPTSGHYFCYVRSSPSIWHKLDDSMVVRVEEEMVLSEAAYILFYVREDAPWFSSLMETWKDPNTSPKSVLDTVESECTAYPHLENSDTCKPIANGGDIQRTPLSSVPMVEDDKVNQHGINNDEIAAQISSSSISPETKDNIPMSVSSSSIAVEAKNFRDEKLADVHSREVNTGEVMHKIQRKDVTYPVMPPASPDPEIYVKQQPESRRKIRRDHPMVENAMMVKKLKKGGRDENARSEAVRYINKNFSSSRAMQLMAAMAPKAHKKSRLRSSVVTM